MQNITTLEAVLRQDRGIVLAGVAGVAALAWAYTVYLAWDIRGMAMPLTQSWGAVDLALMFIMWAVMMVAMMVPTAAPMILVFAKVNRTRREQQRPFIPTGIFLGGYLIVWGGFAALAALAQWGLHTGALLSPNMAGTSPYLGGALLLIAGVFQWSRLKYACLTQCRTPLGFLMSEWREGQKGALVMGLRHGTYCLGCCWILMGLLFVLGVMNLLWIAALAGVVLIEKVAPAGRQVSRLTGLLLVAWGAWMVVGAVV